MTSTSTRAATDPAARDRASVQMNANFRPALGLDADLVDALRADHKANDWNVETIETLLGERALAALAWDQNSNQPSWPSFKVAAMMQWIG